MCRAVQTLTNKSEMTLVLSSLVTRLASEHLDQAGDVHEFAFNERSFEPLGASLACINAQTSDVELDRHAELGPS